MQKFTESKAITIVSGCGAEVKGKVIVAKNGVRGLLACSALDYLKNYCGYIVNI